MLASKGEPNAAFLRSCMAQVLQPGGLSCDMRRSFHEEVPQVDPQSARCGTDWAIVA